MKKFFSFFLLILLAGMQSVVAQTMVAQNLTANDPDKVSGTIPSALLDCEPLTGQVVNVDGEPLLGATLFVRGTTNAYITDSQGHFLITAPVYRKQVVAVEAAGYLPVFVTLTDCTLPVMTLERDPNMRIKRSGKRAGQVVR